MGASFIEKRYGWKYGIPAYLAASFVGYSWVKSDKHYTEDVMAGAVIGTISSYIFTKPYREFQITPLASSGFYGINVSKTWQININYNLFFKFICEISCRFNAKKIYLSLS